MASTEHEPILASWKISEVLKHYPQLIDVLVDLSPAFSKLRNPLLRKVQTRLVTVAQAAGIAGMEPAELTRALNQAAGITAPVEESVRGAPLNMEGTVPPGWVGHAPVVRELDVRPMMERGEEPFKAIMGASRDVPIGSVLRLTVGFEPLPLYDAMSRKGFTHWARRHADDAWEVQFHHAESSPVAKSDPAPAPVVADVDWGTAATAEVTIDVSELVPPEPMVKILQALETLSDDSRLLVHHVRRPIHLYTRLDEMGYAHETRELAPGNVEVMIQKRVGAPQQP